MIGSKSQSQIRPAALGMTLQSSVYGQTIPVIFGRTMTALYATWQANVRQGGSKKSKKKGQSSYIANVDFLLGTNPLIGPLQFWENQNVRLPLNFVSASSGTVVGDSFAISDANFYCVLAVTVSQLLVTDFNDYGGQPAGVQEVSSELPLRNAALNGPDPTRSWTETWPSGWYYWTPAMGNTIQVPATVGGVFTVYYAQLDPSGATQYDKKHSGTAVPAAALKLTWEPELGDGPEYTGNDSTTGVALSTQQILYAHYAGLGSQNFDMGGSAMPDIRTEIAGTFMLYPSGDGDFADMIQDIFCSGPGQPGLTAASSITPIQHGLNCYDWPGAVQCLTAGEVEAGYSGLPYTRPNAAGNILIVCGNSGDAGTPLTALSDLAGNSWTSTLSSGYAQLWYAIALAAAGNVATLSGPTYHWQQSILEIAGVDTFDDVATDISGSGAAVSITTTNARGMPAYILAFVNYAPDGLASQLVNNPRPLWETLSYGDSDFYLQYRVVYQPGTYTYTPPPSGGRGFPTKVVLIAFKATQPNSLPKALGNILDRDSLDVCRRECAANGLIGSLVMNSQQKASDCLKDLYTAMNAAPVWSGFRLKSIPYSEVSAVGNGAVYQALQASDYIPNLSESDFIGDASQPLITVERKAQVDVPNILQYQHPNRASDYNDVTIMEPESGSIALYGPRKDSPKQMRMIQDPAVARMLLGIQVRRENLLRNTYKFKAKAKWKLLEPMDVITINDSLIGISKLAVRLTKVSEDAKYQLDCEAEPYIYGVDAPVPLSVTTPQPYQPQFGAAPANVNAPVFIEPNARLAGLGNPEQLWIVVSNPSLNYGGCVAFISTDGGSSYNNLGQIQNNAITGVTVGDWPAAADPDTTNDLAVDLTESNGTLSSYQVSDEDNFVYPCYVAPGNSCIPYELMSYALANLTATSKYTLKATGGHHLHRAVFGAPAAGAGVDHPSGSRFAFVGQGAPGILKVQMDPTWIGKTLHFKFPVYNSYLSSLESLADCTDYTYAPSGCPWGASSLVITGAYTASGSNNGQTIVATSPATVTLPATTPFPQYSTVIQNASSGTVTVNNFGSPLTLSPGQSAVISATASGTYTADISGANNFSDDETPSGSVNGSNVTFTLANTPSPSTSLCFYLNGNLEIQGLDYSISGSTITILTLIPNTGDSLRAFYRH